MFKMLDVIILKIVPTIGLQNIKIWVVHAASYFSTYTITYISYRYQAFISVLMSENLLMLLQATASGFDIWSERVIILRCLSFGRYIRSELFSFLLFCSALFCYILLFCFILYCFILLCCVLPCDIIYFLLFSALLCSALLCSLLYCNRRLQSQKSVIFLQYLLSSSVTFKRTNRTTNTNLSNF